MATHVHCQGMKGVQKSCLATYTVCTFPARTAHPYLVQTFEYGMAALNDNFDRHRKPLAGMDVRTLASPSPLPPGTAPASASASVSVPSGAPDHRQLLQQTRYRAVQPHAAAPAHSVCGEDRCLTQRPQNDVSDEPAASNGSKDACGGRSSAGGMADCSTGGFATGSRLSSVVSVHTAAMAVAAAHAAVAAYAGSSASPFASSQLFPMAASGSYAAGPASIATHAALAQHAVAQQVPVDPSVTHHRHKQEARSSSPDAPATPPPLECGGAGGHTDGMLGAAEHSRHNGTGGTAAMPLSSASPLPQLAAYTHPQHSQQQQQPQQQQSLPQLHGQYRAPVSGQHQQTQHTPADLSRVSSSEDSFDGSSSRLTHGSKTPSVDCVDVLKQLGAAPGKYVVQIVSEWCDEGTLHAAVRKGVFRAQPQHGRSRTWALRALLRTAREVGHCAALRRAAAMGLCSFWSSTSYRL